MGFDRDARHLQLACSLAVGTSRKTLEFTLWVGIFPSRLWDIGALALAGIAVARHMRTLRHRVRLRGRGCWDRTATQQSQYYKYCSYGHWNTWTCAARALAKLRMDVDSKPVESDARMHHIFARL